MTEDHDQAESIPGGRPTRADLGATDHPDVPHTHPLPRWIRPLAVIYGLLIVFALATAFLMIYQQQQSDTKARQTIQAEIDRRTKVRIAEDERIQAELDQQNAVTSEVVCDLLLNDFDQTSPTVKRAILTFRCAEPPRLPDDQGNP